MFANAVDSQLLNDLRNDVNDESKWLALANSQTSPIDQISVLSKAVATVPSSILLWSELVRSKSSHDRTGLQDVLKEAVSLFPRNTDLWHILFTLYPSTQTFTTALRYVDNALVWKYYLKYIIEQNGLSSQERLEGCKRSLEFNAEPLASLITHLLNAEHAEVAAELLLQSQEQSYNVWEPVISACQTNPVLAEVALSRFPSQDGSLVPLVAHQKLISSGFKDARTLLLHHVENPSTVAAFTELFKATCHLYEQQIEESMRSQGQGGWTTAQLLSEYANILRKRPLLLSNIAVAQFGDRDVQLWLDRAQLWQHRPHIAADVIETAIQKINPLSAVNGDVADLHNQYALLLLANGTDASKVTALLESALSIKYISKKGRARLYMTLADAYQGPGNDPESAIKTLETAIKELPSDGSLWLHYMSVLVECKSQNLLEAFSRCCIQGVVSMRIVLLVADAFDAGSSNQLAVFDKGVSMFPVQILWPLWKHYLTTVNSALNIVQQRALYSKAFDVFAEQKRNYEDLAVLYYEVEKASASGSMLLARKRIHHILSKSTNINVWTAYINTFNGDDAGKRSAFELAINRLNDSEANTMAIAMAHFEESLGEIDRARVLYRYASQIQSSQEGSVAWKQFEERNGAEDFHADKIQFVPAVQMES